MDGIVEPVDPELRRYMHDRDDLDNFYDNDSDNSYYSENEESDLEGEQEGNNNKQKKKADKGPILPLARLPDDVLLIVFSFLPFRDKVRLTRVNRQWKSLLTCQSELWTQVIIPSVEHSYNSETRFRSGLVKFMKPRLGPKLTYLDIPVMNAPGLRFLDQKCPNLLSLAMCVENPSLDISVIPSRLTFLELRVGTGNGHARQDWWTRVTHENFPNLKSLSVIAGLIIPTRRMEEEGVVDALRVFFKQVGKFQSLRYLKLAIMWHLLRPASLQKLHPLAKTLESFSIGGGNHGDSVSKHLYKFIGEEMEGLKNLKVSISMDGNSQDSIDRLKHLANIPCLESLYLPEDAKLEVLKEVLPLYNKLTDLHLYDVENHQIQVMEWVYVERRSKHVPRKRIDRDAWKKIVETLKEVRPDVKYHLIEDRKNHRMASAFC